MKIIVLLLGYLFNWNGQIKNSDKICIPWWLMSSEWSGNSNWSMRKVAVVLLVESGPHTDQSEGCSNEEEDDKDERTSLSFFW